MSGGGLAGDNPNKIKGGKWTVVRFFLCSVSFEVPMWPSTVHCCLRVPLSFVCLLFLDKLCTGVRSIGVWDVVPNSSEEF